MRVIRLPGNPLGRYYLCFAHHKGGTGRLAGAGNVVGDVEGPGTVHRPGTLAAMPRVES